MKLFVHKHRLDGCVWYRVKQFMNAISNEIKVVEISSEELTTEELMKEIKESDVFYLRPSSPNVISFIRDLKNYYPNKKIIYDTDDDLFNISPFNDAYNFGGTKEITLPDGTELWKENKRFDPWRNRKGLIDYEYALTKADVVTTTTIRLAETIKPFNKNVVVIPNAIDFTYFPRLEIKKDDKIRLLYSGGSSHYGDMYSVRDDLERLMKEYPNLHFYFIGNPFDGIIKNMDQDRVHKEGWIGADGHGYRLACINADIAICPLEENEFNVNKSSVKYYETAALGIPTVAKDMLPYSADIKHNDNGLLYKNDFYKQVKYLIDNPEERKRIGENAYKWVKKHRDLKEVSQDLIKVIKSLETKFVNL